MFNDHPCVYPCSLPAVVFVICVVRAKQLQPSASIQCSCIVAHTLACSSSLPQRFDTSIYITRVHLQPCCARATRASRSTVADHSKSVMSGPLTVGISIHIRYVHTSRPTAAGTSNDTFRYVAFTCRITVFQLTATSWHNLRICSSTLSCFHLLSLCSLLASGDSRLLWLRVSSHRLGLVILLLRGSCGSTHTGPSILRLDVDIIHFLRVLRLRLLQS